MNKFILAAFAFFVSASMSQALIYIPPTAPGPAAATTQVVFEYESFGGFTQYPYSNITRVYSYSNGSVQRFYAINVSQVFMINQTSTTAHFKWLTASELMDLVTAAVAVSDPWAPACYKYIGLCDAGSNRVKFDGNEQVIQNGVCGSGSSNPLITAEMVSLQQKLSALNSQLYSNADFTWSY